jgi:phosphoribosyl 1,2-cyclic phosphodiesterase
MEIISNDGDTIIVDAGTGIRKLGNELLRAERKNYSMVFTHAHWDHLMGFPFFKPVYTEGISLQLYGCPFAQASIKDILSKSMSPPYFPVNLEDLRADISYHGACAGGFDIGSIHVTPIHLSHPNRGIGYKFVEDDKSFVFLTDNELTYKHPGGLDYQDYLDFSANADLLIHDAEYTREEYRTTKGWGHSVYDDALMLAMEAHVHQFGLFHHNQERTDAAIDGIVGVCDDIVDNHHASLHCLAISAGTEITL